MKTGDIIRLKEIRHYEPDKSWFSYSAPKDKLFVAVLVGIENKDGSDWLDITDALEDLGYVLKNPDDRSRA